MYTKFQHNRASWATIEAGISSTSFVLKIRGFKDLLPLKQIIADLIIAKENLHLSKPTTSE